MAHSLLYEAANSLLTVARKAHPLNDWARRIGTWSSHKKARVALERLIGHSRWPMVKCQQRFEVVP